MHVIQTHRWSSLELDPVGSTVRYEMMKLCIGVLALGNTASFKEMNIFFEWIFGILKDE